ncbi:hypothetical protein R5R35_000550 [Gryllus longicercus]|uniref:Pre-rRNA-processing protein Ipi1 N-terminal domain-containing protein n=2 Tax=Gryllus longicercus TaxID=2509291 RepID=A0AAN9VV48_9ORTH
MVKLTKLKRMEKAKVKLKQKKLMKAQNVTNVSFKAKKIVLPGQLKSPTEQEIHTRKKLNVQELLSHLRHYNVSMRSEGLSGFQELLAMYEEDVIKLHLPKVIDGVASLVLDIERGVRKSAVKMIETLLAKVSTEQITPHFDVLRTYMSCAMTHINASIREDSLLLMDCLLNKCPVLMVKNANDILPNFLNMISNLKNSSDHGRTLSLHLNNKLISVKWRMSVFARLTKYFAAIVAVKKHGFVDGVQMNVDEVSGIDTKSVNWSEESPLYVGDFISLKREICNLPRVFSKTTVVTEVSGASTANQERTLKEHIMSLMPVLFEAWIEVAPQRDSAEVGCLPEEAAIMLQYVVNTLLHVWESIQNWEQESNIDNLTPWFIKFYRKTIYKAFLPGFPFTLQENIFKPKIVSNESRKVLNEEQSLLQNTSSVHPKCIHQNLSLCHLLVSIDDGKDQTVVKPVLSYLQSCIMEWEDMTFFPGLEQVLRTLIINEKTSWPKKEVLQAVVMKCQDRSAPRNLYENLFSLLCDYVLQPRYHKELGCKEFVKWFSELPYQFFQAEVNLKTVKALSSLACQNHEVFMNSLKKRAKAIVNSLCEIPVVGNSIPFEGQKLILNTLFHVADSDTFNGLLKRIGDLQDYQELASYVKDMKALYEFVNL